MDRIHGRGITHQVMQRPLSTEPWLMGSTWLWPWRALPDATGTEEQSGTRGHTQGCKLINEGWRLITESTEGSLSRARIEGRGVTWRAHDDHPARQAEDTIDICVT